MPQRDRSDDQHDPFLSRRSLLRAGAAGLFLGAVSASGVALSANASSTASAVRAAADTRAWRTVWEDRFLGSALNTSNWTVYDGPGQTDLRDQQWNDPSMVTVGGGRLALRAQPVPKNGFSYIAGSLSSKGKRSVGPHGRLTTRQFLHPGHGASVGVCLFGTNIDEVGWPAAGEIDATEIALSKPGSPFGSAHGPGYSGEAPISATYDGPLDSLVGRWVTHSLEWEPGVLRWAIDGHVYHEARADDPRAGAGWPFDASFFIVLTLTVGSYLGGDVDVSTWPRENGIGTRTARAEFDYIRFEQLVE
jgi:beta-glucanase (GH16 family)